MPLRWIAMVLLVATTSPAHAGVKRALLVGINDYSASGFATQAVVPDRDWLDLHGAVNDAKAMRELLQQRYGFNDADIVTLLDQRATREAILQSIERHLVQPAGRDDVVLFYYAGHGSQVANSLSDEADQLDESIVPADSKAGARDIRDKELRPLFNAVLDRGARLTVILDNCHSGSGARNPAAGGRPRAIRPDLRDLAAPARGPRPEDRGALVLSAAQDFDRAWEIRDAQQRFHGAFSWALLGAMGDASTEESARETFLRARARMRAGTPHQEPVLAGTTEATLQPFLGDGSERRQRNVVVVERVREDGRILLQGGWAHGLLPGTELRVAGDRSVVLHVTDTSGLGRSEARAAGTGTPRLTPGAMLEPVRWTPPRERPLPRERSRFRLALRCTGDGAVARRLLRRGARYELLLRSASDAQPRYVYVFVVDRDGRSTLLFPRAGSIENRLPTGPREASLGFFETVPPYGIETFFLITADQPLADPWILEWNGGRTRSPALPSGWTVETFVYETR
jgi:Caspase domain